MSPEACREAEINIPRSSVHLVDFICNPIRTFKKETPNICFIFNFYLAKLSVALIIYSARLNMFFILSEKLYLSNKMLILYNDQRYV